MLKNLFDKILIKLLDLFSEMAVAKTNSKDVQTVMEWLLAHPEDEEFYDKPSSNQEAQSSTSTTDESTEAALEAKSLKCDECGRLFKTHEEVEFHAAKSGHSSFSESTEEKKPLTVEEKAAQKVKLDEIMKQKRKEREENEKLEAIEREKDRIRSGKEMIEARKKQEDMEMKKLLEQRKREKEEERLARQRVRDQIEQDKLARKAKAQAETAKLPVTTVTCPITAVSTSGTKNYIEAKLQIRLTNGSALTHTFGAKEPLSAVRLYVEMNRTDEPGLFSLMTSFPRKVFTEDDYDKPLDVLGLAPSAVIIVTKS